MFFQRKHDSSSSEDSEAGESKYLTPASSAVVTPVADSGVEKKHKKKHKKSKDGETVDTPVSESVEKKVNDKWLQIEMASCSNIHRVSKWIQSCTSRQQTVLCNH